MLLSSIGVSAYEISGSTITGVPHYTTASDFVASLTTLQDAQVVVKSADGNVYTNVAPSGYVNEQCLVKSGSTYYSVDLIDAISLGTLKSGRGFDISSIKNCNTNMAVSFSMTAPEAFVAQTVTFKTGGKEVLVFEARNDGFVTVADVNGAKTYLERYSASEMLNAELVFERTSETSCTLKSVYLNGVAVSNVPAIECALSTYVSMIYKCTDTTKYLKNLCAMSVSDYTPTYKSTQLSFVDTKSRYFPNYGENNTDTVYHPDSSTDGVDLMFGSVITQVTGGFKVTNIMDKTISKSYALISALPNISKVRFFKDGVQIYTLVSGTITARRDVPSDNIMLAACYNSAGAMTDVDMGTSVQITCTSEDTVRVFVFNSINTITPLVSEVKFTKDGIFQNDGYEK